jgi:hypothetical protein
MVLTTVGIEHVDRYDAVAQSGMDYGTYHRDSSYYAITGVHGCT